GPWEITVDLAELLWKLRPAPDYMKSTLTRAQSLSVLDNVRGEKFESILLNEVICQAELDLPEERWADLIGRNIAPNAIAHFCPYTHLLEPLFDDYIEVGLSMFYDAYARADISIEAFKVVLQRIRQSPKDPWIR